MEGGRRNGWLVVISILACFCLIGFIWMLGQGFLAWRSQQLRMQGPPAGAGRTSATPPSLPSPRAESFMPSDATLVDSLEADLDDDGEAEIAIAFNSSPEQAGLVILDYSEGGWRQTWEAKPPLDGAVTKAEIRDVNLDGSPEILLFNTLENQEKQVLCVYAREGADHVLLTPVGGPLEGRQCFVSAFYAPEFRNVDVVDVEEILVYEDDPSHTRLVARPYWWDGEAYSYASWLFILGRPRPSSEGAE